MTKRDRLARWALAVEIVGIAVGSAGIGIEVGYKAHLGFVCITTGALAVALGSLIWAKVVRL